MYESSFVSILFQFSARGLIRKPGFTMPKQTHQNVDEIVLYYRFNHKLTRTLQNEIKILNSMLGQHRNINNAFIVKQELILATCVCYSRFFCLFYLSDPFLLRTTLENITSYLHIKQGLQPRTGATRKPWTSFYVNLMSLQYYQELERHESINKKHLPC